MNVVRAVFNSYLVNSYLLIAENKMAVLIDPACSNAMECERLQKIIEQQAIELVAVIATHTHADHVMGAQWVMEAYPKIRFMMHKEAYPLYISTNDYALLMGFEKRELPEPTDYITDEQTLQFSDIQLRVLYTPGHAPGSVCLYSATDNVVFSGDVLFRCSVGRTDLPGGDWEVLRSSLYQKLLVLPDETLVLPGHGDSTNIRYEKENNPFL
jgi:glyoxylase-like metal-dependent hydrolase (beta-lactamase superfamily II)